MRKILWLLALVASLSTPAYADFTGKDASAATITFKNPNTCSSVVCTPIFALYDTTGANGVAVVTVGADGASNTANGILAYDRMLQFNGTTWDRWQGAVKLASGGVASGAFASGSISSGAFASGSIGSGAVASGAVASGAIASGAVASGAMVDLGSQADAACGTDNGSCSAIALIKRTNQDLTTVNTSVTSAVPVGTNRIGYTSDDPCASKIKTNLPISQNGTSSVQLIALSGATTIYVCAITLVAASATTVALTTGTGTACVTGNAAVIGSTTANIANSIALAANNGWSQGSGAGTVASGAASSELCMILGTNVFVSGNLTYVQQ
jgi:hypothetical protein